MDTIRSDLQSIGLEMLIKPTVGKLTEVNFWWMEKIHEIAELDFIIVKRDVEKERKKWTHFSGSSNSFKEKEKQVWLIISVWKIYREKRKRCEHKYYGNDSCRVFVPALTLTDWLTILEWTRIKLWDVQVLRLTER